MNFVNLTLLVYISGAYATVWKARNRETKEVVALKRVKLDMDNTVSIH